MLERLLGDDVTERGRYLPEIIYGTNDDIVTTFAVVAGVVVVGFPLLPYLLVVRPLLPAPVAVTALSFLLVGASRSLVTDRGWLVNGGEMFAVGMAAATVAYVVGNLLGSVA